MTLGRTLRDAREASGMSIELLAKDTNIRPTLLLEMEADNFELCGGDTYARGHLRNIAKRIGIDAQLLINLYNDQHAVESQRIQDSLVENNVINVPREEKKLSWKIPAVVSLAILAIVGIVQIIVSNQSSDVPNKPSNSSSQTSEPSPTISANPSVSPTHGPIDLVISAPRGNSYIDIIVDGQDVEKGSIFQGETKKYKGTTAISIYFSNPAGLDVTLNGKLLAPLGGENQEVRRTFR
jgi:cytoskeletal protein RodZ